MNVEPSGEEACGCLENLMVVEERTAEAQQYVGRSTVVHNEVRPSQDCDQSSGGFVEVNLSAVRIVCLICPVPTSLGSIKNPLGTNCGNAVIDRKRCDRHDEVRCIARNCLIGWRARAASKKESP